ncbi:TPA: hypothetical protein DEW47_03885 [Patescibacteria group bacterium]|nr:MAG: hypothetical protein UT71_C0003G0042 [Parcubacteria group bacterium GW2011_GWF2_40_10]KKR47999.1 MAG: hypothetical protein UT83_C0001G0042 [Parcubacteria group bacterium GW2011_GWA2_40_143]KKR60479.1 MAG: hypothetical protein UT97_C0001G0050 [Parcubacteria group bacterium GW2011_GWC2_40_31]KKR74670.1 MAG: hypothetical protein UU18_C0021G0008 [Parcubacteria group bacterium GW2011_GWB2_40_8]KKR77144.1 MAG: hypothetical protein UU20_C0014G0002 [Parcubacteria group bacterium GW2011_GWE2_40_
MAKKSVKSKKGQLKKEVTIDDLALMVAKGFEETHKIMDERFKRVDERFEQIDRRFDQIDARFEGIDARFERVDEKMDHINARLSYIERDVSEIRQHLVYRHEFDDLMSRVKYMEEKLNIDSGK